MKIIKITAIWCVSCILMNNTINEVKKESKIETIDYDYDDNTDIVLKYNVGNILPVLIFIDESGNEIKRLVGEKSKKEIIDVIKELKS